MNTNFPDPTVMRASDGTFYVYGTQGNGVHIQVASSADLVTWAYHGEALAGLPPWASTTAVDTWAPDVQEHGGTFYMYFAAQAASPAGSFCVAVATSPSPLGPFNTTFQPIVCGGAGDSSNIDPKSFDDAATNATWLFWGSGAAIHIQQLAQDRLGFAPGSVSAAVWAADSLLPYQSLVEGAWVLTLPRGVQPGNAGSYLLITSGNNCCGTDAHYALFAARGLTVAGPYAGIGSAPGYGSRNGSNVILAEASASGAFSAPGHNSAVFDDAGTLWAFYHAYQGPPPGVGGARVLMMDAVVWDANGWPGFAGGAPSQVPQPAPVVNATAWRLRQVAREIAGGARTAA
jgi:arabinan endo-1,5-alpha-L-arabinosidase